jgi:deoxyribose-phosphate aldolase
VEEIIMTPLNSKTITLEQLAKTIDHSLLKPELTEGEVVSGCMLAARYHVASVCVRPSHVKLAARLLKGTGVKVCTVIGFPFGYSKTEIKAAEARQAIADGAVELDMVINIGELRSDHLDYVRQDIRAVVEVARDKALIKVILENAYLTDEQKVTACKLCEEAGADFVKTSTGFAPSGATLEDLRLMRASVSPRMRVKAAGGVRTLDAVLDVIDTGATRIGATTTAAILDEFTHRKKGN